MKNWAPSDLPVFQDATRQAVDYGDSIADLTTKIHQVAEAHAVKRPRQRRDSATTTDLRARLRRTFEEEERMRRGASRPSP